MKNPPFSQAVAPPPSTPTEQPTSQVLPQKKSRKNLFVSIFAIMMIVVVIVAVLFVQQSAAGVISLGVDYPVGEKLTYTMKLTQTLELGNSTSNSSADGTMIVEVMSLEGDTYTLNCTISGSSNANAVKIPKLVEVKKNEMATVLSFMPAISPDQNYTGLFVSRAAFDQTQAKVGDTWTIPMHTEGAVVAGDLRVTFKAIQDLTVDAGTFRVFRIDLSTDALIENQSSN